MVAIRLNPAILRPRLDGGCRDRQRARHNEDTT
jgi:hypothetical protein